MQHRYENQDVPISRLPLIHVEVKVFAALKSLLHYAVLLITLKLYVTKTPILTLPWRDGGQIE